MWAAVGVFFLLACQTVTSMVAPTQQAAWDVSPIAYPTMTQTSTPTETVTPSVTPTDTPVPTWTVSPTSTLELVWQGPYELTLPILLYHHIATSRHESRYYVTPEKFDEQMNLLRNWGYTTITLDMLVTAIKIGAELPARPVIITFDDGQENVYANAFPIMEKYGFKGVVYIVGTYLDAPTFMTTEQVKQLTASGWEVGSHSMRHKDLTTQDAKDQLYEISESRKYLESQIGVPVKSFAYPFGFADDTSFELVHNAGYTSAMGVGFSHAQGTGNIYLLQRRDIQGGYNLIKFASFLPWGGDASFLPTEFPTPLPEDIQTP